MKTGPAPRAAGFTLIEVVCALAILIFLFGGVYGIASGALTLSRASNEARTQELRLNNLDAMLRTAFEELPASTQFELETGDQGSQLTLITEVGSGPLMWSHQAALADRVVLRLESDPAAKGRQRLVVEHWTTSALGKAESIGQLRLLAGLAGARWRLFDVQGDQWEELWTMQKGRPLFAELTFEMKEQPGEQRMVFWVPAYMPAQPSGASPTPPAP